MSSRENKMTAAVVVDGANERWKIIASRTVFTLRSEKTGKFTTVDDSTLKQLRLEVQHSP